MNVLGLVLALVLQADGELYNTVSASSVEILVGGQLNGSGWIADSDGHVVTAAHVVWRKKGKLEVRLSSGVIQEAKRVAIDLGHDLALVRLPPRDKPWSHLEIANDLPKAGAEVFVFGSPQFRHRFLLPGRMARPEPGYEYLSDLECAVRVIHIGGSAPSGMSGGCWVDGKGRVIGNQSGGITIRGHATSISFAAPGDAISRLVRTRKSASTVDGGVIVEELDEHGKKGLGEFPEDAEGVLGAICRKGGPASEAGLHPRFIIGSVDGEVFRTRDAFYRVIRAGKPGDRVKLSVIRKGEAKPEAVEITLESLEDR